MNACEYQYVKGANGADIHSATGSVSSYTITDGTICFDFSSGLPFNYAGTQTSSISGGTGEFTGVTGSRTYTFAAAVTAVDPAGHGSDGSRALSQGR
jgi:hypothetical protein